MKATSAYKNSYAEFFLCSLISLSADYLSSLLELITRATMVATEFYMFDASKYSKVFFKICNYSVLKTKTEC